MSLSNEQMIDYLDNQLEGEERLQAEQLISQDAAAAQELEALRFSVELVREAAVLEQVTAVRNSFEAGAKVVPFQQKESGAVVRSFSRSALRIAVMIFLLVGAAGVYKYSTVTNSSVYNENFTSFDLETSRGSNSDNELEKAYRNKNWAAAENIFAAMEEKSAQSWFLAGMSAMELKNYDKAILSFHEVMSLNKNKTEQYYQDEAEYYLGMAYLGAGKVTDGVAILRQIRGNKDHLFYKRASRIAAIDLKTLELKK